MRLFKYQPINNYSLQGLVNRTLFFSDVEKFNDPYEFTLHEDICSNEFVERARRDMNIEQTCSPCQVRDHLRAYILHPSNKLAVVSFSSRHDSPLMWGHYAQNHSGMRLEFEANDSSKGAIMKVTYSDDLPKFQYIDGGISHINNIGKAMSTKHTDWKYEDEYRMFNWMGEGSYPYGDGISLISIAFGLRTSEQDIKLVRHLTKDKSITYYKSELSPRKPIIIYKELQENL